MPRLSAFKMTTISIPRTGEWLDRPWAVHRLEDYHTILDTRRASGKLNKDAVITRRQYLVDASFGVILEGDQELMEKVVAALRDPRWGIWLGRKSCIPAEPILRGFFDNETAAWEALIGETPPHQFTRVSEVDGFEDGTDSIDDQPVGFGNGGSSGSEGRQFTPRRIKLEPGNP